MPEKASQLKLDLQAISSSLPSSKETDTLSDNNNNNKVNTKQSAVIRNPAAAPLFSPVEQSNAFNSLYESNQSKVEIESSVSIAKPAASTLMYNKPLIKENKLKNNSNHDKLYSNNNNNNNNNISQFYEPAQSNENIYSESKQLSSNRLIHSEHEESYFDNNNNNNNNNSSSNVRYTDNKLATAGSRNTQNFHRVSPSPSPPLSMQQNHNIPAALKEYKPNFETPHNNANQSSYSIDSESKDLYTKPPNLNRPNQVNNEYTATTTTKPTPLIDDSLITNTGPEKLFSARHLNQRLFGQAANAVTAPISNINANTQALRNNVSNGLDMDSDGGSEHSCVSKLSSPSVLSSLSEMPKGAKKVLNATNSNNSSSNPQHDEPVPPPPSQSIVDNNNKTGDVEAPRQHVKQHGKQERKEKIGKTSSTNAITSNNTHANMSRSLTGGGHRGLMLNPENPTHSFFLQFSPKVVPQTSTKHTSTTSLPGQSMQNLNKISKAGEAGGAADKVDGTLSDSAVSSAPPENTNKKRRPSMAKALVILGLSKKSNSTSNVGLGRPQTFFLTFWDENF